MLFSLLPLQVVALVGSLSMSAPLPPPLGAHADVATAALGTLGMLAEPVDVVLFDANHKETYTVRIGRDGSIDATTRETLEHAFRCRRSERERGIDRGLLAMIADVQARWPGHTIEYISAYRNWKGERKTSPHRAGRAFDFRVQGVKLTDVRDYVWTRFEQVGVGWYPDEGFVHMDHRHGEADIAWTEIRGNNRYHPSWSTRARRGDAPRERTSRVGL